MANDKRQQILEAAQKRFAHFGLSKTTLLDIANDLDISKASLYYYFDDKEALFRAVVEKEQEEFFRQVEIILEESMRASEMLKEYVVQRQNYFRSFINLGKISLNSIEDLKPLIGNQLQAFRYREFSLIEEILKKGILKEEFDIENVPDTALLFQDSMRGLRTIFIGKQELKMLTEADYEQMEKRIESFTNLFIKGIQKIGHE